MALPLGTCSIGGITMRVPVSEAYLPLPVTEVFKEITHIPWSNTNIIDNGGLGVSTWKSPVEVAEADHTTFEGMSGGSGLAFVLYGDTKGPSELTITSAAVWIGQGAVHYRYDVEVIF